MLPVNCKKLQSWPSVEMSDDIHFYLYSTYITWLPGLAIFRGDKNSYGQNFEFKTHNADATKDLTKNKIMW